MIRMEGGGLLRCGGGGGLLGGGGLEGVYLGFPFSIL